MARHHLSFRNLRPGVIAAADQLFSEKPWRKTAEEQQEIASAFADAVTALYGAPHLQILHHENISRSEIRYRPALTADGVVVTPATFFFGDFSILTFFFAVRVHLLATGAATPVSEEDPRGWACSLFYTVKPAMFRARAREGRVYGVSAKDTFTTATWRRLIEAGLATDDYLTADKEALDAWLRESNSAPDSLDWEEWDGEIAPAPPAATTEDDGLDALNRDAIRALAARHNVSGRGRMNKDQLIAVLRSLGITAREVR